MAQIWIINQYASTPTTGRVGRHHYFASNLAARGHDVVVIGSSWHHLLNEESRQNIASTEKVAGYTYMRIGVPSYKHAHDFRRVINWFIFSSKIRHIHKDFKQKPDVILYSSPSLIGWIGAKKLAKTLGCRLVFEIRDIWPLTLEKIGNISSLNPLIIYMKYVEHRAYLESCAIISALPGAIFRLKQLGHKKEKFTFISNGISLEEASRPTPLPETIINQFKDKHFIAGYAGTFGTANALKDIVTAAELLRDYPHISIFLVGNGRNKETLQQIIKDKKLQNIHIIDSIPKESIQSLLAHFDVCLINWHDSGLYQFGTAANKIFDYLYAGKPIIHGYAGYFDYIAHHQAGISVKPSSPPEIADAIVRLSRLPINQRQVMGDNGKYAAINYYSYEELTKKLEHVLCPTK